MLRCTWGNISPGAVLPDKGWELTLEYWFPGMAYMCHISSLSCHLALFYPFLFFLPLQKYWTVASWSTRTNSCATPTPSTGRTSSKTPLRNSWWYRPTAVTLDVSITTRLPPKHACQCQELAMNYSFHRVLTRRYIILQSTSYCIHVFYNSICTWGHLQSIWQSVGFNLLPYMCQILPLKPRPCIFPELAVPVVCKICCITTILSR